MLARRTLIAALAAAGLTPGPAQSRVQTPPPPTQDPPDSFSSADVQRARATVPVMIGDQGPFQFIVDTAANCSVIASDLVERLALPAIGQIAMHTLIGREVVPAVRAERMHSGALNADDVLLAVGQRSAIAGLDGLLGCDLLLDSKIVLNFRGGVQRIRIARSTAPARSLENRVDSETPVVVRGERRLGGLLVVPVRAGNARASAIIDSGAEGTILNRAAALAARARPFELPDGQNRWRIQSPTGEAAYAELMILPVLELAGMVISDLPVAVGDFHTFGIVGLQDQPAMLIGLDVFNLFKAVHIDLRRSEFSFRR